MKRKLYIDIILDTNSNFPLDWNLIISNYFLILFLNNIWLAKLKNRSCIRIHNEPMAWIQEIGHGPVLTSQLNQGKDFSVLWFNLPKQSSWKPHLNPILDLWLPVMCPIDFIIQTKYSDFWDLLLFQNVGLYVIG